MSVAEGAAARVDWDRCPVCGSPAADPFITIERAPAHCNVLWTSAEAAVRAPIGRIELTFCDRCGHVFNQSFDEGLTTYGATYENSLHHSAVFQSYAEELVDELVERHDLHDRDLVEIGAGQGDFLQMLCAAGHNRATGFDPSFVGQTSDSDAVRLVADFYGEQYADHPADFIVCRHVLEHIGDPGGFVAMVRRVIGERHVTAFFEVPNVVWTLRDGGLWDIIHEHCGYFSPSSLATVFASRGFGVDRVATVFGGQFLTIEASPGTPAESATGAPTDRAEISELATHVNTFADRYISAVERWQVHIDERRELGERGVIWGAGSKGVAFLNAVDGADVIDRAVDLNPRKHGMFVAGTGQPIVAPSELRETPPSFVITMNPNYAGEIDAELRRLDIACPLLSV